MIDEVRRWSQKAELPLCRFIGWLGIATSKFYSWLDRYGKANEHNGPVARGFWLESWEKEAILRYQAEHPLEGYRRLAFMMLDENVVAVSPSSVWRVLHEQGRLHRWGRTRTQGKRASSSRWDPTNTGISTSPMSTWPAPSTTS